MEAIRVQAFPRFTPRNLNSNLQPRQILSMDEFSPST